MLPRFGVSALKKPSTQKTPENRREMKTISLQMEVKNAFLKTIR
jgi:hypothetical protein